MDKVAFGFFENEDMIVFNKLVEEFELFEMEYNYKGYNSDFEIGFELLLKYFNLHCIGILSLKKTSDPFNSNPVISQISEYYISTEIYNKPTNEPYFFEFIDAIENSKIKNFILTFADEFDENSRSRLEEIKIKDIKKRLFSGSVWEEEYLSLKHNIYFPENYHPLILKVSNE